MDSNNNNNDHIFSSESIFEDSVMSTFGNSGMNSVQYNPTEIPNNSSFATKLFNAINNISDKIENHNKEKELKQFTDDATKLFKDNEDLFKLLNQFNCKFITHNDYIEFTCKTFNLNGKILILPDGNIEFDENALRILYTISEVMKNTENVDNIIDSNEEEGFYPVGELIKKKIMLNGEETEVLAGILANSQGQSKEIFYYKGKEVRPDNE